MRTITLTETLERQSKRTSTPEISAVLVRVQSEYLEMPGLKLTEAQARRLWGLDGNTCRVVLVTLIERGFLKRSPNGHYVRARG
jgi:predicted transcriptional regulator of viral defense system